MRTHPWTTRAAFAAALLLPAAAWPGEKAEEIVEVTVTGESAHSFEEAKEDALRKAVEMGGGKIMRTDTHVRDFQLIHDTIISRAVGYVRHYYVLSKQEEEGVYKVKVRAQVSTSKIEEDWGAIEVLIVRKGRPNILVVVEERTEGLASTGNAAEYKLRDIFDKLGFDLVDDEALAKMGERGLIRAEIAGDERRAAAIAAQLHASYAVTGRAHVRAGTPIDRYGVTFTAVSVSLDVKVVEAGNAKLLASKSASAQRGSRDPVAAARLALQLAAADVGRQAIYRMLEHWARDLDVGATVLLVGTRIDTQVLNPFIERLRGLDGVKGVNVIDHNAELTTIKVTTRLEAKALADEIPGLSGGRFAVTGYTRGRIEFAMKAEVGKPTTIPRKPPATAPGTQVVAAPQPTTGQGAEPKPSPPEGGTEAVAPGAAAEQASRPVTLPLLWLVGGAVAVVVLAVALTMLLAGSKAKRP